MTNERIARTFERVAELLERQGASPFRARAWREGARGVREHDRELDIHEVVINERMEEHRHGAPRGDEDVIDRIRGLGRPRDADGEPIPGALRANLLGMSESFSVHSGEPIDVRMPTDRVAFMLADSRAAALLGVANAFDIPARQAFVMAVVPPEERAAAASVTPAGRVSVTTTPVASDGPRFSTKRV